MANPDVPANRSIEDELTDGYAQALAIEAECLETMRRMAAADGGGGAPSDEAKQLAGRLGALQAELKALRLRLDEFRRSVDPDGRLY
jgi:hypothetical protein